MLYQLSYARAPREWWGKDSNLRRLSPADLQSATFGHSGTPPRRSPRASFAFPEKIADPTDNAPRVSTARGVLVPPNWKTRGGPTPLRQRELTKGLEPLAC